MVYVETWLHITGLLSTVIIFIISIQQICITSIGKEKPKSIYRIMTSIMAFTEFILHFAASLWYLSSSISDRNIFSIFIHILRFMSAVLISVTFYPILIHTIQHFYNSREFKDELKIPKWLLSPWKYIILFTIICCIICYIITFITNSLSSLFIYYIIADIVTLCACITLFVAMFDVYFKVKETALSLDTRLEFNKQYEMEQEAVIAKQNTISSENNNNNNHKIDVGLIINKLATQESVSRANTLELEKAKNEINKGRYFIIACFIMIILAAIRSSYILYANIHEKQYYDKSTLETMAFETVFSYLGSVLFVIVYDGGLLIWLWKSSNFCRDLDHYTIANKLGCRCKKSFKLQRVNTGLKDEPNEKKQVKRRNKDNETTKEIDIVTDELGHTVAEEYEHDEITKRDEREQTDIIISARNTLKILETNGPILSKRPTVTPAPGGIGHIIHQYSTDLDGLQLIKCKIIIYLFELVITNCVPSIFYRKTATQIQQMNENKFIKQFGGKQRIEIIQKHILEMSKGAILYCITSKMNIKTLEAIMERLDLLKYFIGPFKKELLDHLNQITSIGDRGISEHSQSPPNNNNNNNNNNNDESPAPPSKISNIYIPSKLATLDEHKSAENKDGTIIPISPSKDDNDEVLDNVVIQNRTYMSRSRSDLKNTKSVNIIKHNGGHGGDIPNDVKLFYQQRLFGKNTDIMKETKGNSQINLLIFKFLDHFDVLNDEILVITSDLQTTSYFKSIGLCKGYHIDGGNGLNHKDIEEIQKYL